MQKGSICAPFFNITILDSQIPHIPESRRRYVEQVLCRKS